MKSLPWMLYVAAQASTLVHPTLAHFTPRDYDAYDYYALHLRSTSSPHDIAKRLGLEYVEPIGKLDDHHLFRIRKRDEDVVEVQLQRLRLRKRDDLSAEEADLTRAVRYSEKQKLKRLVKRIPPKYDPRDSHEEGSGSGSAAENVGGASENKFDANDPSGVKGLFTTLVDTLKINDPIFKDQWHLINTREITHDVNVGKLWLDGVFGENATVAIVDDGLDFKSHDLAENYFKEGSWDFNDPGPDPLPRLSDDRHGTRCAGEVAAARNDVCGVGVAYKAKVAGIRILSKSISDADEAVALNYAYEKNNIYSCSWGPPDDGIAMDAPGILIKKAIQQGVQKGRDGKGSIFVFASGNGAANGDNCNFDGYTNSIYSITVGAIDRAGAHPYYSEECSANLVVTYSSGSGTDAIHTTDVGVNSCYTMHGGTSAAAPLAAGIFALVVSVRPDLTWRDMQYLCVEAAVPVNDEDGDWEKTTIGKKFNHKYGYGKIDAVKLVEAARNWKLVKPQAWFHSAMLHVDKAIPDGAKGLSSTIEITKEQLENANLERLEHVTVTMDLNHTRRGDLDVDLISPNGLVSRIAVQRPKDSSTEGYKEWTFMTVKHWGESGIGKWTIIVKDTVHPENRGSLNWWRLNLWGESIDGKKQKLHPLPGDDDDENDPSKAVHSTSTVGGVTTSVTATSKASASGNPSGHPERPVKSKTSTGTVESSPTTQATSASDSASTTATAAGATDSAGATDTATSTAEPERAGFIPSFFPTFGVSAATQAWIYGAIGFILVFGCALGGFLFWQRKKRQANKGAMDDYEFARLAGEGDDEAAEGLTGSNRRTRRSQRGRDLYDAFGESDEEDIGGGRAFADDDDEDEKHHVIGEDSDDEVDSGESYEDVPSVRPGGSGTRVL
ncbi:pheromone processing endoprotease [Arthrobotrys musiformis]|uniref:Pheromone processing endoprotease n=1 Tax=Arthrobotrys musiformis TaxID=47236 RepID=A0AAV9WC38_9PEZI